MQLYSSIYKSKNNVWRHTPIGLADLRFAPSGNKNLKAQMAVEYVPQDISGSGDISTPGINLKRLWVKARFPNWRLTAGKTKVAWGNGFIFNAGDILFGSASPVVDYVKAEQRDDTAFLAAFNIPVGRFSYFEAVVLPPNLVLDTDTNTNAVQTFNKTSAGIRFFGKAGRFRIEGGYLYKGDKKVVSDLLGHRPYLSFHASPGLDIYGAASLAAGYDSSLTGDDNRDTWEEIARTVSFSAGVFHQFAVGYRGNIALRIETSIMPWQLWAAKNYADLAADESYGLYFYPSVTWLFPADWSVGLQSMVSPIDGSAQLAARLNWKVFQGFALFGIGVVNLGKENTIFGWDRSKVWPAALPDYSMNGMGFTLGIEYTF